MATTTVSEIKKTEKMTKSAWDLQKTLGDLSVWRTWGLKTLEGFRAELKTAQTSRRLPTEDVVNMALVMAKMDEIIREMKALDSPLHKATGQRIRKDRKG